MKLYGRLILAGVVVAIKYNEDDYFSNSFYAKVGGISLNEINVLETEFINLITFKLFIDEDIFKGYLKYLMHLSLPVHKV
jgi:hypothetical protein